MTHESSEFRVPTNMADKLAAVRDRTWKVRLATALVCGLAVLLVAMGLAMAIDRWATLYSPAWRTILTLSALTATAMTIGAWILAAWHHVSRVDRVAADVDRSVPKLEERWSTIAELSGPEKLRDIHPAMLRQVAEEANQQAVQVDPQAIVRLKRFNRAVWGLTAVTGVLIVAVAMDSHRMAVSLKRFWLPMANISATEIHPVGQTGVVARGESLEIAAELVGTPVKEATLFLQPAASDIQEITLVPRGDAQNQLAHRVRAVREPLQYRLRAGDGQTDWQQVIVADRPELAAATLTVVPPDYTQAQPREFAKLPRRLSALVGSRIQLAFKPRQAIAKLHLDLRQGKSQPLLMDADGWYRWETTLIETTSFSPILEEKHGLVNRRPPQCTIQARPDKPPVVRILTPNDQMAVRPDDRVPITFEAKDDVRVGSAELVVYDESNPASDGPRVLDTIPIPLGDQEGKTVVKATVDLDLSKYQVPTGAELSFAVRVREDRSLAPNTAAAESLQQEEADASQQIAQVSPPAVAPPTEKLPSIDPQGVRATRPGDATAADSSQLVRSLPPTDVPPAIAPPAAATAQHPGESKPRRESPSTPASDDAQVNSPANVESMAGSTTNIDDTNSKTAPLTARPPSPDTPKEPSTLTQAIAEALPDEIKKYASDTSSASREGAVAATSSANTPSQDNPSSSSAEGGDDTPTKESLSDRQALNMAADAPAARSEADNSQNTNSPTSNSPTPNFQTAKLAEGEQRPEATQTEKRSNKGESPTLPVTKPEQMASTPDSALPQGISPMPPGSARNQDRLDVAPPSQTSMSNRMKLKIDEWAGSVAGQERTALEMAIAPELLKLDEYLEKAEKLSRNILDSVDGGTEWLPEYDRDIDSAGQQVARGMQIIEDLEQRTHGTPYAFVGLQLVNVAKAHMQPARRDFWKALQTDADTRIGATRDGWQHTVRAREVLAELTTKFETARQEYALAESVEKVKKMYQVFVENSMALLSPDTNNANSSVRRKRVEFDVDEEYLARLKEVLEMRNNMRAELAKILADDPRLLRRFLDSQQNRRQVLRHELQRMIESQNELNREVQAWSEMDESDQADLQAMLLARHTETAADLAVDAAVLQDRFETWLPLAQEAGNTDVQTAARLLQDVATATQELSADAETFIAQDQAATLKEPAEDSAAELTVENIASGARTLHDQLTNLEVALRQLGIQESNAEMAVFAANRLVEIRELITHTSEWLRQLKHHQDGNYHNAAEVEQYRLARQTDALAGKLAGVEQQMAGLLQRADNKIPEEIALKARELLASLDEQAAPNQLSAVYSLRRNQVAKAVERQQVALAGIEQAAKNYDELIRLAVAELDKLPVQDPIASLLQDPTLDELLAGLEREFPIEELLGIPNRPSNLQIADNFGRMGGDNALSNAATWRMLINQLMQRQRMRQRRLDQAYRRAVARALQEVTEDPVEDELEMARETVDWNVLLSQLGDDLQQGADKAPPERYRRAIEQYFRQVSQPDNAVERN